MMQETTNPDMQLDEVEVQKGFLQIAKGLEFLHDAKLIHTNLTSNAVVINAKGDWKLCGCAYLTNVSEITSDKHWAWEEDEHALPEMMRRDVDVMDPVYVMDHKVDPSNDMYSLGILFFMALHRGAKPYQTYGSISAMYTYVEELSSRIHTSTWNMLGSDAQSTCKDVGKKLGLTDLLEDILTHLITRKDTDRYSAKMFQQLPYFNSMLVRILKFMERESFSTRSRSEQVQFLRGMYKMLPQFSMALLRRKLLPNVSTAMTHSSCWKPPQTRHYCLTFFRMSSSLQSTSVRCDA